MAVGHSAYVCMSLSRVKSADDFDILTICRMSPFTPDMFTWNIFTLMYVFMNMFLITRVFYLLTFYCLAAYHIVQEFTLLKQKVTDLQQPRHQATPSIINELRQQYDYSLSLTKMLDSLLTWPTFLGYSIMLPTVFVFIYVLLRVPLTKDEFPSVIEALVVTCIYIAIPTVAGTYINTASKGTEDALYQIGINWSDGRSSRAYQTFLLRVSTSDVGITALGFFTISKGTVLTMVGTIVSYVIVILQFPASSYQVRSNATLHP
ncbi:gustatory receptor for bitter taste 66a-like [Haliotis asinina]|uniref:gustatory receptor for bitter taste 66a-like n=1 Tax=Haliotis asinina TaxID=109174 RepID=UPI00353249F3